MHTHIVIDLDGTLLNHNKEILPLTKKVLLHVQKELGKTIILASGRPVPFMEPLAIDLEMDKYGGFLISNNGATVYDCERREYIFENKLMPEEVIEILNQVNPFKVVPVFHYENYLYVEEHHNGDMKNEDREFNIIDGELNSGNYSLMKVKSLVETVDFPVYKVLVAGDSDYINANQDAIRGDLKEKYNATVTGPVALEFTKKGVDKAFSLDWLAREEGFTKENLMAFGDGPNDISLIQYVDHGVGMGNGVSELKALADAITLSNLEDGIGIYLNDHFNLDVTY